MKKLAGFIVEKRALILILSIIMAIIGGLLITKVKINYDMSKYLPDNSVTKTGIAIINNQFPAASKLNIMFKDLKDDEKTEIFASLEKIEGVTSVIYDLESERYNKESYTLYSVAIAAESYSTEANEIVDSIKKAFGGYDISMNGEAVRNDVLNKLPMIFAVAYVILLVILFLMCNSWIEPFLFLADIGIAILINMGSNVIFGSVSDITNSIAAVLQVCLSMDYSIMLLNRYRQEKLTEKNKPEAMKKAIVNASVAITSSSVTTIVGMLALTFMSFTIGRDLGFVLAKGVFISLLCIFTVLPALILKFDNLIEKTEKKPLHLKMDKIASFGYSKRYFISIAFVILFACGFMLRNNVAITYSITEFEEINSRFMLNNQIVVVYENGDEKNAEALAEKWLEYPFVDGVNAYGTTLGKKLTAEELAEVAGMNKAIMQQFLVYYALATGASPQGGISIYDFVHFITGDGANGPLKQFLNDETSEMLETAKLEMDNGLAQLVGDEYSRIIIDTSLAEESEETFAFIADINRDLDEELSGEHFVIGASAMAYEMSNSFPSENNFITLLTAAAIFLVIAIAFRSLSIAFILVCIIQCAVFFTMSTGGSIFYLPLLIVQCLLMGAAVDYGILLCSYYREARKTADVKSAVVTALNNSIHTIMTSGLILITVTLALGVALTSSDPSVSEILITIAKGGCFSSILVIFVLPAVVTALDRFTVSK